MDEWEYQKRGDEPARDLPQEDMAMARMSRSEKQELEGWQAWCRDRNAIVKTMIEQAKTLAAMELAWQRRWGKGHEPLSSAASETTRTMRLIEALACCSLAELPWGVGDG